jgi:hypothetical protein
MDETRNENAIIFETGIRITLTVADAFMKTFDVGAEMRTFKFVLFADYICHRI